MGSLTGDGNGSAVTIWIPIAGADEGAAIVARRFAPSTGWAPMETIDPPGPNIFQDPVAAMDAQGSIMAVWPERSGLLAAHFVAGSGWGGPTRLSREYSSPFSSITALPAVGVSSGGRVLAVWSECCGGSGAYEIGSNRFDPATGWLTPDGVWAIGARDVSAPALAVVASGSALAVWAEADASRLWMSTFDPRRGWAVSQPIALLEPARILYGVRVALNTAGEGFALWTQDDTLFASRYTTVTGFAAPAPLGRGGAQGLAVDAAGNALALWVQPPRLFALRYTAGRGWEAPLPLPPQDQDANGVGALSMDTGGNAWFVWADSTGVWSRRYVAEQGLGLAERVSPTTGPDFVAAQLQIVADAQGGAVAAWLEPRPGNSSWNILANRYVAR
jgi:hypothetical protein